MSQSPWTEERVGLLRRLKAEGISCARIAAALSLTGHKFTRNAVIAKCDRLGLETLTQKKNLTRAQYAAAQGRAAPPIAPVSNVRERGAPRGRWNVTYANKDESHCLRFVGGESHDTGLICGRERAEGKPYCKQCCAECFDPVETGKRRAA